MGNLELAIVLEEINWACAATGVTVSVHNSLLGAPILRHGTREQQEKWLPDLASGATIGAYCLTEANAGSDAAALATTAVRDGDDWVLNGTKLFVTNGREAGLFIVYARTDPDASKAKGISAFLVPAKTEGLSVGKSEMKTGIRGSSTTEILLENVRIPGDQLVGQENRGFHIAMDTLDGGRIGIASQGLGVARACLEAAVKYANEREQFGRPIGDFQADPVEARRHVHAASTRLAHAGPPCGLAARPGRVLQPQKSAHGQAPGLARSRELLCRRVPSDSRWRGVHRRFPRRATVP